MHKLDKKGDNDLKDRNRYTVKKTNKCLETDIICKGCGELKVARNLTKEFPIKPIKVTFLLSTFGKIRK